MRKIILILSIFSFLSFSSSIEKPFHNTEINIEDIVGCKYGQCQAIAKSTGKRCKHCVSNSGDTTCYQH